MCGSGFLYWLCQCRASACTQLHPCAAPGARCRCARPGGSSPHSRASASGGGASILLADDDEAPVAAVLNPAVTSLLNQARGQYQAQNYLGAIATAERALLIDRRAADIYLLLAQSYMQLDQPHKAKMFVQQGLRYAQPQSEAAQGLLRVREIVGS